MTYGHGNRDRRVILIAHNIRSLYNIGSLFRTADAAGASKIFLTGYSGTPDNPKVAKVALGAEKTVLWEKFSNISRLLKKLRKEKFQIVAAEQHSHSISYKKLISRFPLALLMGNEIRGLSPAILKKSDVIIEIPMRGKKESLNVSVAFGIIIYQILS